MNLIFVLIRVYLFAIVDLDCLIEWLVLYLLALHILLSGRLALILLSHGLNLMLLRDSSCGLLLLSGLVALGNLLFFLLFLEVFFLFRAVISIEFECLASLRELPIVIVVALHY
jgi:hypothetical protein